MSSKQKKVVPFRPQRTPTPTQPEESATSTRVGTLVRWSAEEGLFADYPGNSYGPLPARTVVPLTPEQATALANERGEVLLAFDGGDPRRPIVMGVFHAVAPSGARAFADGREVLVEGAERVELRCGKASIVLTKAGRVQIRGTYISSTSAGAHRIRGGSVEIN